MPRLETCAKLPLVCQVLDALAPLVCQGAAVEPAARPRLKVRKWLSALVRASLVIKSGMEESTRVQCAAQRSNLGPKHSRHAAKC